MALSEDVEPSSENSVPNVCHKYTYHIKERLAFHGVSCFRSTKQIGLIPRSHRTLIHYVFHGSNISHSLISLIDSLILEVANCKKAINPCLC